MPPGMECHPHDFGCNWDRLKDFGETVTSPFSAALDTLRDKILEGVGNTFEEVTTMWVQVDSANLSTNDRHEPSGTVGFIQDSLEPYMLILAAVMVAVGGAKMAYEHRAEPGKEVFKSLVTLILFSAGGVTVASILLGATDRYSEWIIDQSSKGPGLAENMLGLADNSGVGAVLMIVLGIVALIGGLIQLIVMLARGVLVVLLAGTLPLSASFSNTDMGRSWQSKNVAWLLAWIAYKPAAATVYATGFKLAGENKLGPDGSLLSVLGGLMVIVMAIVALPALMRFVSPANFSGGGGGGSVLSSALPAGAVALGMRGRNGGGGSPGPSGPSGPSGGDDPPPPPPPSGGSESQLRRRLEQASAGSRGGGTPDGGDGKGATPGSGSPKEGGENPATATGSSASPTGAPGSASAGTGATTGAAAGGTGAAAGGSGAAAGGGGAATGAAGGAAGGAALGAAGAAAGKYAADKTNEFTNKATSEPGKEEEGPSGSGKA